MIISKRIRVILDTRVFHEYEVVLSRPGFNFPPEDILALIPAQYLEMINQ